MTCTYTAERNEDGVPGFDVVLEEPIILKRNEVVILSATIKGDHSCFGEDGLSSVESHSRGSLRHLALLRFPTTQLLLVAVNLMK